VRYELRMRIVNPNFHIVDKNINKSTRWDAISWLLNVDNSDSHSISFDFDYEYKRGKFVAEADTLEELKLKVCYLFL